MNILVESLTNLIKYQGYEFSYGGDTRTNMSLEGFIQFSDVSLNKHNSGIYEVETIEDFVGDKYKYIDGEIVLNPNWIEPERSL
jgi:hypothetical protein